MRSSPRSRAAPTNDKPVLAAFVSADGTPQSLVDASVATFDYPESAARALGHAAARAEWLRRPAGTYAELDGIDRAAAEQLVASVLESDKRCLADGATGAHAARRLRHPARPGARRRERSTARSRRRACSGFPVVVKTAAAGAHKTESGGVALDLAAEDDVRAAVERIGLPVLVQPMVRGSAELLAGVVQDPTFGPLVAFGPGGVFAELIGEAQFRLAPLTTADAEELVTGGKAGQLVAGFRGAAGLRRRRAHRPRAASRAARRRRPGGRRARPEPGARAPDGCVAVDARVRVRPSERARSAKTW